MPRDLLAPTNQQAPRDLLADMPSSDSRELLRQKAANETPASIGRTVLDQGMQGLGTTFSDEVANRIGALIASSVVPELSYEDALNQASNLSKNRLEQQMKQHPVISVGSDIAGATLGAAGLATTKAGLALASRGGILSRIAKGAAIGGASGALSGAGAADEGNRAQGAKEGAGVGAVVGGAIPIAGTVISAGIDALSPRIAETTAKLASRARDFGIPLSLDQLSPTRIRKTVQKVSQEMPFSGVDEFQQQQRESWNRAIAQKALGQDANDLAPDVIKKFRSDNSALFSQALDGKPVSINANDVMDKMSNIWNEAGLNLEEGLVGVVKKNIDMVLKSLPFNQPIPGQKLASIRSELIKRAANTKNPVAPFISDIVDVIDESVAANLPEKDIQKLAEARRQWRNYKTLEPLLEDSTDGTIDPTKLMNRVKQSPYIKASMKSVGEDDLVDLARIGKQFLPKAGGSDTFQKSVVGGGVGAVLSSPSRAISSLANLAVGLTGNRAYQAANQSQLLSNLAINMARPERTKTATPLLSLIAGSQAGN